MFDQYDSICPMLVLVCLIWLHASWPSPSPICGLSTQALLPVVARMPHLQQLGLSGNSIQMNDLGLSRLSALSALTNISSG